MSIELRPLHGTVLRCYTLAKRSPATTRFGTDLERPLDKISVVLLGTL